MEPATPAQGQLGTKVAYVRIFSPGQSASLGPAPRGVPSWALFVAQTQNQSQVRLAGISQAISVPKRYRL